MPERKQFKLPDVGEGLTEAEIISWRVRPGDKVGVDQTIVEIETAKAAVELPCPWEGVVTDLLVEEGQTVDVGTPIIAVDVVAEGAAEAPPAAEPPAQGAGVTEDMVPEVPAPSGEPAERGAGGGEERQPVLVGYGVRTGAAKRRPRKTAPSPGNTVSDAREASAGTGYGEPPPSGRRSEPADTVSDAREASAGTGYGEPPPSGRRSEQNGGAVPATGAPAAPETRPAPGVRQGRVAVLAKPPVRKLAKDLGVDLAAVEGTGPGGTITRSDVESAAARVGEPGVAAPTFAPTFASGEREERVPIRGVRKHMAAAMTQSAFTAPHVTEFLTVDVTPMVETVERIQAMPDFAEVRVSPLLLVAKALLLAVRRNPMVNATWDERAQEIVVKRYVNLGIAAATSRGLVVPNIKGAESMTLPELARALRDLTATAREGRTSPTDMQGGTITITNVGVFGIDAGTPILNPGEAAILGLGAIRDMPWVHKGQVVPRKVVTLALSFDHRLVDGELGSTFLADIGAMLSDPTTMLVWS